MDVKERRKKVEELLRKNLGIYDIAKLLGYATRVIERDVIWIEEHGKSREPDISLSVENEIMLGRKKEEKTSEVKVKRSKQIAKRREGVARLYNEGKTANEIAEELGISKQIVYQDIRVLIEEKRIVKRERKRNTKSKSTEKSKQIAKRREEIARLYNEGKTVKEIAEELGVTIATVYNAIKVLEAEEKIERHKVRRKKNTAKVTKRREEIARLYNEGKTAKEIAEELGISKQIVYQDIRVLIEEKRIVKRERKRNTKSKSTERSESNKPLINKVEKIEELFSKGKDYGEIADELGMSIIDVMRYLQQIKDVKEETRIKVDRKTNVKILYEEGKKIGDIAKKLKISEALVREDLLSFGIIPDIGIVPKIQEEKPEEQTLEEKTTNGRDLADKKESKTSENRLLLIKERRENIAKLYDSGMENDEIARILNIPLRVIERDIDAILDARRFKDEDSTKNIRESRSSSQSEEEQEIITKRRNRIEELVKQGKNIKEIEGEPGVEEPVIAQDIFCLIREGRIPESYKKEFSEDRRERRKDKSQIIERREQVAKLYKEGKNVQEIAEELGITISTVRSDIKLLLKQHIIEKREFERKNGTPKSRKEEKAGNEGKEQTVKQRREQVLTLYASGKSKTKEEKSVRTKSEQRYYNNILKVIKMCLQSRDFKGAVDNIEMLKNEVKLSEEEKDKLDELLTAIVFRLNSHKVAEEDEKDR